MSFQPLRNNANAVHKIDRMITCRNTVPTAQRRVQVVSLFNTVIKIIYSSKT